MRCPNKPLSVCVRFPSHLLFITLPPFFSLSPSSPGSQSRLSDSNTQTSRPTSQLEPEHHIQLEHSAHYPTSKLNCNLNVHSNLCSRCTSSSCDLPPLPVFAAGLASSPRHCKFHTTGTYERRSLQLMPFLLFFFRIKLQALYVLTHVGFELQHQLVAASDSACHHTSPPGTTGLPGTCLLHLSSTLLFSSAVPSFRTSKHLFLQLLGFSLIPPL